MTILDEYDLTYLHLARLRRALGRVLLSGRLLGRCHRSLVHHGYLTVLLYDFLMTDVHHSNFWLCVPRIVHGDLFLATSSHNTSVQTVICKRRGGFDGTPGLSSPDCWPGALLLYDSDSHSTGGFNWRQTGSSRNSGVCSAGYSTIQHVTQQKKPDCVANSVKK